MTLTPNNLAFLATPYVLPPTRAPSSCQMATNLKRGPGARGHWMKKPQETIMLAYLYLHNVFHVRTCLLRSRSPQNSLILQHDPRTPGPKNIRKNATAIGPATRMDHLLDGLCRCQYPEHKRRCPLRQNRRRCRYRSQGPCVRCERGPMGHRTVQHKQSYAIWCQVRRLRPIQNISREQVMIQLRIPTSGLTNKAFTSSASSWPAKPTKFPIW